MMTDDVLSAVLPIFDKYGIRTEECTEADREGLVAAALQFIDSAAQSSVEAAVQIVREEGGSDRIVARIQALLAPIDADAPPRPASASEEVLVLRDRVKELESRLEAVQDAAGDEE